MGQPYDGRATDAWSLGVLLYALLESRLPFDPHPGMSDAHRMRSRTSHRIARVEWRWVEFAGEDGGHEASEAKFSEQGLLGAMEITEGLLKRAFSQTKKSSYVYSWLNFLNFYLARTVGQVPAYKPGRSLTFSSPEKFQTFVT
ncbi:hypothetical protein E4U36_007686 [Claviceps purpurea]|nr:hypothetical protein E4U36_007686 [Claviceps purpurea]